MSGLDVLRWWANFAARIRSLKRELKSGGCRIAAVLAAADASSNILGWDKFK
jgi:hypothetical protein